MNGEFLILPRKQPQRPSGAAAVRDLSVTVVTSPLTLGITPSLSHLRTLPLLQDLSPAGMTALIAATRVRTLAPGELLFTEGQPARSVFVVHGGALDVRRTGVSEPLAEVGTGAWLGLFGLLAGRRRCAEVRARLPSEIAEIDASSFVKLLTAEPLVREAAKTHFHHRLAQLLCSSHPLFADLPHSERAHLASAFHTLDLKSGRHTVLVEPEQTAFYAIAHGQLRLAVPEISESLLLARGHIFGVTAGSVALEPLTRVHLLRLSPADCDSAFFEALPGRARARGLYLDRHLFVGDAGIPGLS